MSHIERLGYFFHPSAYPKPLGHAAVEVFLSCNEDNWFFPTRSAIFPQVEEDHTGHLHITCPWLSIGHDYRIAPGTFFIVAQNGDLVEGFSFGGELAIEEEDGVLNCLLTSSAPCFDLSNTNGLASIIAPEFEAGLARLRAEWAGSDEAFDRRVALVEPFDLFVASLLLSESYAHRLPAQDPDDSVIEDRQAVNHALHILRSAGEWPDKPATLHQLVLEH